MPDREGRYDVRGRLVQVHECAEEHVWQVIQIRELPGEDRPKAKADMDYRRKYIRNSADIRKVIFLDRM